MYAYGTFFDREGRSKIDLIVNQSAVELGFTPEEQMTDEQYNAYNDLPFYTTMVVDGLRIEFDADLAKFLKKAAKGKAILVNDEEWLFAVAATKEIARKAFLLAYANEIEADFD